MRRRYQRDEDDDDIVQDGQRLRVPLTMMDSVQRAVTLAGTPARVVDGQGGTSGLHRPGVRIAVGDARKTTVVRDPRGRLKETWETEEEDADAAMSRDQAYADYERTLVDAWRGANGQRVG